MTEKRARELRVYALAVLSVAGLGLGMGGYVRGTPTSDAVRFYLASDGGAVLFEHKDHSLRLDSCVACHHELAGEACDCQDCHDDPSYSAAQTDHAELLELHERACDSCHEIAPAAEAESCRECHAETLAQVYHQSCSACHLASARERFADAAGEPKCQRCHLR